MLNTHTIDGHDGLVADQDEPGYTRRTPETLPYMLHAGRTPIATPSPSESPASPIRMLSFPILHRSCCSVPIDTNDTLALGAFEVFDNKRAFTSEGIETNDD